MSWRVLESGKKKAAQNMALDAHLLEELKREKAPLLHFYDWDGEAATYGYFLEEEQFANKEGVLRHRLDLARRPTGGGVVFHNCDLAFSVLIPASHPDFSPRPLNNYAFVNQRVKMAVETFIKKSGFALIGEESDEESAFKEFCMAHPTKYDVILEGRKVGGAAQRKTAFGFLHQGSILLGQLHDAYLCDVLVDGASVATAMREKSRPLLPFPWTNSDLEEARTSLKALLKQVFI